MIVAYVLVSNGRDRYATMCHLSAAAVHRVHPDARVVLVTDPKTRELLGEHSPRLKDVIDEFVVEPAPMPEPRARSFYLKSRLRNVISGDFIFLDCDTLPVRPFTDIADGDWDLAFVLDRSHHGPIDPVFPFWEVPRLERMGWKATLSRYFNTGVGFYRDNAAVRALATEWHRLWNEAYARGDDWDQLAFNVALEAVPVRMHVLPISYNAMVVVSPLHANGAKIYHFFAGNQKDLSDSLYEHLIRQFESDGTVDWSTIDRCVARNHPWMPPYWPRRLWLTGNRLEAVRLALANLPARLARAAFGRQSRTSDKTPEGATVR